MKRIEYRLLILMTLPMMVMQALSCKTETAEEETEMTANRVTPPDWSHSANLYEVNIRQYTPEGTFEAFNSPNIWQK